MNPLKAFFLALISLVFGSFATAVPAASGTPALGSVLVAPEAQLERLSAELHTAPVPILQELAADPERLREFVVGRLHDERIAIHALEQGLDRRPEVMIEAVRMLRALLVQAAIDDALAREHPNLPDPEPLARQYYLANIKQYRTPEAIRVAHILLRADVERHTEAEIAEIAGKAQELHARIAAGDDFHDLAREYSEDGSAERGGELPKPQPRGTLVPSFETAAWALAPGEVSGVVRSRFGFHLIKLLERIPESHREFEQVRTELVSRVRNEALAPVRNRFIDSFRDGIEEQTIEEVMDALRPVIDEAIANKRRAR